MSIAALDMPQTTRHGSSDLAAARPAAVPLTRLRVGQTAVVQAEGLAEAAGVDGEDGAAMLRAMGLTPEARIRLCRLGEPCIVAVRCACGGQTRIGLARRIASRIMVQVVA